MTQQGNEQIYYMVVDEKSTGPFTLDEVILHPQLTPETLVWKPGIENWVAAKTLAELAPSFAKQQPNTPPFYTREPDYPREQGNPGPDSPYSDNSSYNQNEEPYNPGPEHPNPGNYNDNFGRQGGYRNENVNVNNPFANNPQYQEGHRYHNPHHNPYGNRYYDNRDRYRNDYRPNFHTNWLPWAIVATVVGFFTSCIGAIFGIIGIVQANKANSFYARSLDAEGDAANSSAKTMTIIGLIFAGIGILALFWFGSFFNTLGSFSYL